jgi:hypothetical protein
LLAIDELSVAHSQGVAVSMTDTVSSSFDDAEQDTPTVAQ